MGDQKSAAPIRSDCLVPLQERAWRHRAALAVFIGVFAFLLIADLVTKHLAFQGINIPAVIDGEARLPDRNDTVVPHVLAIRLTLNAGAVFGLGKGWKWFFVLASGVAVAAIVWFFAQSHRRERVFHVALALILAGAVGNLYDRLMWDHVRDMLYLFPGVELPFGWTWPGSHARDVYPWIFNVADVCLLAGIGLILWKSWRNPSNSAPVQAPK